MPQYRYQSLTTAGKMLNGVVDAPDRQSAVRLLLKRGETATEIEESSAKRNGQSRPRAGATAIAAREAAGAGSFLTRRARSLNKGEMANLIRELATALEAGLPLMLSVS